MHWPQHGIFSYHLRLVHIPALYQGKAVHRNQLEQALMELESELLHDHAMKVSLDGRLDIAGANDIDMQFTALTATKKAAIVVDLSKVDFLASIGIRLLLSNAKASSARGGKMVLLNPQPMVKEVLESSGVGSLIPVFEDEQAAYKAVRDL